jgi:hypothetical protein
VAIMDQLNIKATACLKNTMYLFETIVTNVCTGAVSANPHGTDEFAGIVILFVLTAIMLGFALRIMLRVVFGY